MSPATSRRSAPSRARGRSVAAVDVTVDVMVDVIADAAVVIVDNGVDAATGVVHANDSSTAMRAGMRTSSP
jgi:hypothetical protein